MRTIKFRAWERKGKIMIDWLTMTQTATNRLGVDNFGLLWRILSGNPKMDVMQFTGLLDKNGKEIYEGDIVFAEEYVGFNKLKAEVIYNRGRFCLNTGTIPEDLIPELCEIIGNIYENPELLN